jgi:hypothetical protein
LCCQFWAVLFLICHVFFGALWLWHCAIFFIIWLHHFDIYECYGVLLLFHLASNCIRLHQLVHFLVVCKCCIWIVLCIWFIYWPFLF